MKKSVEMKQNLEILKQQAKALLDNKEAKLEDIQAINKDIEILQAKIVMQEAIEADEEKAAAATALKGVGEITVDPEAKDIKKEFINGLRTRFQNAMSSTPVDGGYTIPQDIQTKINELRTSKDALQNLITVEPVTAPKGSRVFKARAQQTGFAEVLEEGTAIAEKTTPQFTQLSYSVKKYAGFLKCTNELLSDSDAAIESTISKWLGDESRVTRNKLILTALATKAKTALANIDAIKSALNITLDPAFRYTASITTNQDGFNWLDTQKDSQGNYLLQPSVSSPTGKQLFGVPIVMVSNKDLPSATGTPNKAPMIIGDLKEALVMFEKAGMLLKSSDVAGDSFLTDITLFRAIEREEVKVRDAEAYINGEIALS